MIFDEIAQKRTKTTPGDVKSEKMSAKEHQRGAKTVPTGGKRESRGAKREPNVAKREPKGIKRDPKEPKASQGCNQNAAKNRSSDKVVKRPLNGPPHQDEMGYFRLDLFIDFNGKWLAKGVPFHLDAVARLTTFSRPCPKIDVWLHFGCSLGSL